MEVKQYKDFETQQQFLFYDIILQGQMHSCVLPRRFSKQFDSTHNLVHIKKIATSAVLDLRTAILKDNFKNYLH